MQPTSNKPTSTISTGLGSSYSLSSRGSGGRSANLREWRSGYKVEAGLREPHSLYRVASSSCSRKKLTPHNTAPHMNTPKYIEKILEDFKEEIDSNTVIVGDFNTPLSTMDRSSRQNIDKEILTLSDTKDQMDLIFIYRTFHPKGAEYTFFSSALGSSSKLDHMLGHKTSLNKFNNVEIISSIFPDQNGIKLEININKET